jgi:hypothetical protein
MSEDERLALLHIEKMRTDRTQMWTRTLPWVVSGVVLFGCTWLIADQVTLAVEVSLSIALSITATAAFVMLLAKALVVDRWLARRRAQKLLRYEEHDASARRNIIQLQHTIGEMEDRIRTLEAPIDKSLLDPYRDKAVDPDTIREIDSIGSTDDGPGLDPAEPDDRR